MRGKSSPEPVPVDLRRAIERLEALAMRPTSARQALATASDDGSDATDDRVSLPQSTTTDPAWAVATSQASGGPIDPLAIISRHRWWPATPPSSPVAEALTRLWRHSMAVASASRRLAKDAGDADPEAVARAGLLHSLGLWAVASIVPEALVAWYEADGSSARIELERQWLGINASSLGRDLATRWGCEPLVVDVAWLHADLDADLNACSTRPDRLAMVQQAYAIASTTPWAPGAEKARDCRAIEPQVRVLTAEIQARSGGDFVEIDATPREERLTRDNARLRLALVHSVAEGASSDRFLAAFVEGTPDEMPETWAERAGLAWCEEPGVASARVVWHGQDGPIEMAEPSRPPSRIIPLGDPVRPIASILLWGDLPPPRPTLVDAWNTWTRMVSERGRLRQHFEEVVSSHRGRVAREEPTRRRRMLDALAEFAAGAGHELNNPLAVIVGRAQLLLTREVDVDSIRSLRAIIAQAQRAARILRDLMYVARPPEPRPRPCQPEEILRACLRDLQADADARGVRIVAEVRDLSPRVWADPEPIRQIADILARNAIEATPTGGVVQIVTSGDLRGLRWTIHDNGRGIGASEGVRLFDPFYCGRQAGRGLGLGLPRAARAIEQAGGELKWQSSPGQGTTFIVTLPVSEIPAVLEDEKVGSGKPDRSLPAR